MTHKSDCAVHNEPAYPPGICDCGAELKVIQLAEIEILRGTAECLRLRAALEKR